MVKHTQTILCLLPTNFLSVFDHFVGLGFKKLVLDLKKLKTYSINQNLTRKSMN